jgi:hypothetical protein
MSDKEFTSKKYDSDGGESSMACNPLELIPPLPKERMLQWWHEVQGEGKNNVVVYMDFVLVYSTLVGT